MQKYNSVHQWWKKNNNFGNFIQSENRLKHSHVSEWWPNLVFSKNGYLKMWISEELNFLTAYGQKMHFCFRASFRSVSAGKNPKIMNQIFFFILSTGRKSSQCYANFNHFRGIISSSSIPHCKASQGVVLDQTIFRPV